MSRSRTIFSNGKKVAEFQDGECVFVDEDHYARKQSALAMPMVIRDIEPYQNMIDGRMIGSRAEHRELLKRHNCFEVGNETKALLEMKPPPPKSTRREKLTRIVNETISDKAATKILKDLRKR